MYGITLVVAIPILISYRYTRRKLALFWREWLTNTFLKDYFSNRAYYELDSNAANTDIDNPDQRMTEDVNSFTTTILDLILDILDSILDLVAFTGILYSISTQLTIGLVGYVSIGTILAVWIGTKLIKINFNQLRLEGDFRYGMVHVRDNAESIAFYRGENLELSQVEGRLGRAIRNYDLLIIWFALLDIFQYAYNYFARFNQPKYVILDEATSALDVTNERRLYELLQSQDITYISVGHRPSLIDYHQTVLDLRSANHQGWQLLAAKDYQFAS